LICFLRLTVVLFDDSELRFGVYIHFDQLEGVPAVSTSVLRCSKTIDCKRGSKLSYEIGWRVGPRGITLQGRREAARIMVMAATEGTPLCLLPLTTTMQGVQARRAPQPQLLRGDSYRGASDVCGYPVVSLVDGIPRQGWFCSLCVMGSFWPPFS